MGGRLDATNIVQPQVSVITNISRDHEDHLGHGLLAIAGEKAGIIKAGAPLVTYATQKSVLDLFRRRCGELATPLYQGGVDFKTRGRGEMRFDYHGLAKELPKLALSLTGRHQYRNAAVALAVLELLQQQGFAISEEAIREGLQNTRWPGRLEQVAQDRRILLDGAHNPAAALTLAQTLKQTRGHGRLIFVMGIMADKEVDIILGRLLPLGQMVIFTRPQYFRVRHHRRFGPPGGALPSGGLPGPPGGARPSNGPRPWPGPTTASSSPVPSLRWGRPRNIFRVCSRRL